MQGGAPSNFLLMRNERLSAPFGSTVKKGWLNCERGKLIIIMICFIEPDDLVEIER